MNDLGQVLFTSLLTVITGVLVLAFGQIVIEFVIRPLQTYRETVGEISVAIIEYCRPTRTVQQQNYINLERANKLEEPHGNVMKAQIENEISLNYEYQHAGQQTLRHLAGKLAGSASAVSWYDFLVLLRQMPTKAEVAAAASYLIGMSNSMHDARLLTEYRVNITRILKIKIVPD